MASRQLSKLLLPALAAANRSVCGVACSSLAGQAVPASAKLALQCFSAVSTRGLHFSALAQSLQETTTADPLLHEPPRKFRPLGDKELWHEAWMYEDRFGNEDSPILVPSLEAERIIGVTDPEDDNLVVWGILREGEPPRQLIENGEFYLLKLVPYVAKVGDVLELEVGQETVEADKVTN